MRSEPPPGAATAPWVSGVATGTTTPAARFSIPHGLGSPPTGVWVTSVTGYQVSLDGNPDSTHINGWMNQTDGTPATNRSYHIFWLAVA